MLGLIDSVSSGCTLRAVPDQGLLEMTSAEAKTPRQKGATPRSKVLGSAGTTCTYCRSNDVSDLASRDLFDVLVQQGRSRVVSPLMTTLRLT